MPGRDGRAKKAVVVCPKRLALPKPGSVASRPSDAPGQRPQSLVLEAGLNPHGIRNFDALLAIVKSLSAVFFNVPTGGYVQGRG